MGESRQYRARTLEVALSKGARDIGVPMDALHYEIVFDGRKGLFGFGQRDVVVEVDVEASRQAQAAPRQDQGEHGIGPVSDHFPEEKLQAPQSPQRQAYPGRDREHERDRGRDYDRGRDRGSDYDRGRDRGRGRGGRRPPRGGSDQGPRPPRHRGRGGREGMGRHGPDRHRRDHRQEDLPREGPERVQLEPLPPPGPPQTDLGKALLDLGQRLVTAMQLELSCAVREEEDRIALEMEGSDDRLAIGRKGEVLDALQYMVNRMLSHDTQLEGRVVVDCAGYRRRQEHEMAEMARRTAHRVRQTGDPVQLDPMNPYQRRIVHMALVDEPGVRSYSTGDGFLRRLTIAPSRRN